MNSRWQANRIGLINFWYYDNQEFPFVKGRMLLRGSNGSGKSVTMQSVIPLLLDGNMSPERLDPFGSRDRKMTSYLLEEDDGREERTGYLYLEFKRQDSDTYLTIGMGICARRGKNLDKWYFSLTDGRRIGKDFFLFKEIGEKVTLSKKELENRIANGGCVFDRQAEYMEYVNRQIFGFETVEEYKELVDLLIQLRTPKLSKDFKPSILNEILSDSLQPLSDDDLRPMSEAIENMDAMSMNLKSRKEALQAADKIQAVFTRYNQKMLYDKAYMYQQSKHRLEDDQQKQAGLRKTLLECIQRIDELTNTASEIEVKREALEKEKESLNKSDALNLKERESELKGNLHVYNKGLADKELALSKKQEQYQEIEKQIRLEEDKQYYKEQEIKDLLEDMSNEAEIMRFEEHRFMQDELEKKLLTEYNFSTHTNIFSKTKERINEGVEVLQKASSLERQKDDFLKERESCIKEISTKQRRMAELESLLIQVQNEWKENLYKWNNNNHEMILEKNLLRQLSDYADSYRDNCDFTKARQRIFDVWSGIKAGTEAEMAANKLELERLEKEIEAAKQELFEWENKKEPVPKRSEAVLKSRERLESLGIPYKEFYKTIEFGNSLDEAACNYIEEALVKMNILDALVIDEQYKAQVLKLERGCEDRYLFVGDRVKGRSLLDVLELNDEMNDIFSSYGLTSILGCISYEDEGLVSIRADGTYKMGILSGTVTGEYEASFLGARARERHIQMKIRECREVLHDLQSQLETMHKIKASLLGKLEQLDREYEQFPNDTDMQVALNALQEVEKNCGYLQKECTRLEDKIREISECLMEKNKEALEIANALYLTCSYTVFSEAKKAAENYGNSLVRLISSHEMYIRFAEFIYDKKKHLEDIDIDMEHLKVDIRDIKYNIRKNISEQESIAEQLKLTDYEQVKERLDYCIGWLSDYPRLLSECVNEKGQKEAYSGQLKASMDDLEKNLIQQEEKTKSLQECYAKEFHLHYCDLGEIECNDILEVIALLEPHAKNMDKDSIVGSLNRVYFENRGFLADYNIMQNELFGDEEATEGADSIGKRIDLSARYQGVKVTFHKLLQHLKEDIEELENLIKDGDRELFEDILANTVSRKIRGKINASIAWVQNMNELMNGMNTSSGLKLSLRWRSKTAEREDQLDTKELVELLKKDYRLMSEKEAAKLSAHFRSKVDEARRGAKDSLGQMSFYQIMKETLDYRRWFEFQLFSQKSGERLKELTNSVFGTFSGGEKAMSMYVPLFSAVVAKYQGGRADAPRIISLDEAFAGVDNRNIRDMFRLMTEFKFDFIINSQVLWGDCDTLDALAIYQLLRPENAKFVAVMPYLWNGYKKELLESEEELVNRC